VEGGIGMGWRRGSREQDGKKKEHEGGNGREAGGNRAR